MRLTRAYLEMPLAAGKRVTLPGDVATHLVRVLRLEAGDPCTFFNGDGHDYGARIVSTSKREVLAEIVEAREVDNESPLRITLLQGIARGEKMDLIVQKATELGVHAIVPVISERSEVKLDAQRAQKRHAHWRGVVIAACEQSGRTRIPDLTIPQSLQSAASAVASDMLKLTLDPGGQNAIANLSIDQTRGLVIAIGPEGGWSPRDRQLLQSAGFIGLRLGPRILRTETAGLAAISALQARLGDLV
ncbi:MAG: 16S rRNA (uracil(1498)-N(3))-methyltransferase [Pseudomonadota bacterium]|nr:16S rRNA (uracil(1498)-N(3))-methyltransferase [Pseudomonadota bacterium]